MPWVVTLQINDCDTGSFIPYPNITDGYVFYTGDANGQFIAVVDDYWESYGVTISKSGYLSRGFVLHRSQAGTIQTTCLNPAPPPPSGDGGGGIECFIVTAATGSAQSEEVTQLKGLRDRVSVVSGLSAQLIDAIYAEYYEFSPAIAAELARNNFARQGVRLIVVKPLVAWYTLAGVLAFEGRAAAMTSAVPDVAKGCPRFLGPSTIASMLDAIRTGAILPADAPQLLRDLEPQLRAAAALPLASWAILDPLCRVWSAVARRLDVIDQVAEWLATAPLDALPAPADPRQLEIDLAKIAGFLDFKPSARSELGSKLLRAWPDATAALMRTGFIEPEDA